MEHATHMAGNEFEPVRLCLFIALPTGFAVNGGQRLRFRRRCGEGRKRPPRRGCGRCDTEEDERCERQAHPTGARSGSPIHDAEDPAWNGRQPAIGIREFVRGLDNRERPSLVFGEPCTQLG